MQRTREQKTGGMGLRADAPREHDMNIETIGIDHIYIAVSDLARSERSYDRVLRIIAIRNNTFTNEEDQHIHYFYRHFGSVLRPAHRDSLHEPLSPGLHHLC